MDNIYKFNKKLSKDLMAFADLVKANRSKDFALQKERTLRLEKRGIVYTPAGKGYSFSMGLIESTFLRTSFYIQMRFIVVDHRQDPKQANSLVIYPSLYGHHHGTWEVSCSYGLQHIGKVNVRLQKEHASFAEKWLYHLKATGYLRNK
jgi:hypothetical protein